MASGIPQDLLAIYDGMDLLEAVAPDGWFASWHDWRECLDTGRSRTVTLVASKHPKWVWRRTLYRLDEDECYAVLVATLSSPSPP